MRHGPSARIADASHSPTATKSYADAFPLSTRGIEGGDVAGNGVRNREFRYLPKQNQRRCVKGNCKLAISHRKLQIASTRLRLDVLQFAMANLQWLMANNIPPPSATWPCFARRQSIKSSYGQNNHRDDRRRFAVLGIWLTVRIINRREKWAKRAAAMLVAAFVGYPLSYGPFCWFAVYVGPDWTRSMWVVLYWPLEFIAGERGAMREILDWWLSLWATH
ncbi:MAG TPA: hypothetical protein VKU82_16575 [Planctomycetaceae bacterium]|nr:hypothetical protein [Planctomycetaceae bacterium]